MIDKDEREQIIALINREVVPAIGCTEPMAVSLCVAKAAEALGVRPARIDVLLSSNILKNAMGVGIPGTGMIGLPIAIALGAIIGKSDIGHSAHFLLFGKSIEFIKERTRFTAGIRNPYGSNLLTVGNLAVAFDGDLRRKSYTCLCNKSSRTCMHSKRVGDFIRNLFHFSSP
jgi:hypothetical protein